MLETQLKPKSKAAQHQPLTNGTLATKQGLTSILRYLLLSPSQTGNVGNSQNDILGFENNIPTEKIQSLAKIKQGKDYSQRKLIFDSLKNSFLDIQYSTNLDIILTNTIFESIEEIKEIGKIANLTTKLHIKTMIIESKIRQANEIISLLKIDDIILQEVIKRYGKKGLKIMAKRDEYQINQVNKGRLNFINLIDFYIQNRILN